MQSELVANVLEYWFGALDDNCRLDRSIQPFQTQFRRWYGKDAAVDEEIRQRFERHLKAVVSNGRNWDQALSQWEAVPQGPLALTILLDQLPRNMYRDTSRMYEHDALGLAVALMALRRGDDRNLPLVRRMFLYVPLMHVENLTLQQQMLFHFEDLATQAARTTPVNADFWRFALDYANRHEAVIRRFGRFPHRNALLGRTSTPDEREFLKSPDSAF
jgi:uncharacterized protein (DUF924 family)